MEYPEALVACMNFCHRNKISSELTSLAMAEVAAAVAIGAKPIDALIRAENMVRKINGNQDARPDNRVSPEVAQAAGMAPPRPESPEGSGTGES